MSPNERGSWLTWTDDGRLSAASDSDLGRKASGKDRFAYVASRNSQVLSSESKGQSGQTLRGKSVGFPEMEKGHGCTLGQGVGLCCGAHLPNPPQLAREVRRDPAAPPWPHGPCARRGCTWPLTLLPDATLRVTRCSVKQAWPCAVLGWPALPLYWQGLCSLSYLTSAESLRGAK